MAKPPRTAIAGTFFITAITANRRRLFQTEANAKLFLDILQHYRAQGLYKLHAYVIMPDHIHLLLTTDDLPKAMKHIRGGFSHRLSSKLDVWQRGYADHLVQIRQEFESRHLYIHQNPVRARLTSRPEEYPYSSASRSNSSPGKTIFNQTINPHVE
jgi:REP-associated tyrosine transposase